MTEPMSDARLASIAQRRDYQHTVVLGDCIEECPACAVEELLVEVKRARAEAAELRKSSRIADSLPWQLRRICCDHYDHTSGYPTWEAADRARLYWEASGAPSGDNTHERRAILTGPQAAAESAEAEVKRVRAQLAEALAQRDEWHRQNGLTRGERDQWRQRAEAAEHELAELRERIADHLRRQSHEIRREAEKLDGARGHSLRGESAGYWMAARDVLDGAGDKPTCESTRTVSFGTFCCVRIQGHAGQHRSVTGMRWGLPDDEQPEGADRGRKAADDGP